MYIFFRFGGYSGADRRQSSAQEARSLQATEFKLRQYRQTQLLVYAGHYGTLRYIGSKSAVEGETVAITKTITLTFRSEPGLKEALRTAAEREYRFIANMVEAMIRDYCGRNGITIPEQQALVSGADNQNRERGGVRTMARETKETKRRIEHYVHKGRERLNNPPVGLVTLDTDKDAGNKTYAYAPHLDPQLCVNLNPNQDSPEGDRIR